MNNQFDIMRAVKRLQTIAINWLENGDILLPLVIVSVVHYADALARYDFYLVGASIGFLTDIGHYRTVKLAFAGKGWFWAIVLTLWSYFMHAFYYYEKGANWASLIYASTVPVVIFALGWINKTSRIDEKIKRENEKSENGQKRTNEIPKTVLKNPIETKLENPKSPKNPETIRRIMERFSISRSTAYKNYEKYEKLLEE